MKTDHQHAFSAWFYRHNFGFLLGTLLLVYAIRPFVGQQPWVLAALQIATLLMMGTAVASFWQRRMIFAAAVLLGLTVQTLQAVQRFTDVSAGGIPTLVIDVLFMIVVIVAIAGRLLKLESITMNAVFGVCSIYLLMAICWSGAYVIIETVQPHSFSGGVLAHEAHATAEQKQSDLLYFSLITMTTVGYGDIAPATQPARSLAALQGLIGQLFLATILARIVSMEIGERMASKQSRRPKEGG